MSQHAGALLDAVRIYVDSLSSDVATGDAASPPEEKYIPMRAVVRDLRDLLDYRIAGAPASLTEHAMQELGLWSARFAERVPVLDLVSMLIAEVTLLHVDVEGGKAAFLQSVGRVWDDTVPGMLAERAARDAARGDRSALDGWPSADLGDDQG